jgi:hypothetical protein
VPLTVDGLIYASSMVMLDSARRKVAVPALARFLLGLPAGAPPMAFPIVARCTPRGRQFGSIGGKRVFGLNGRYVATIVGDRLIHRSTDAGVIGSTFAPSRTAAGAYARAVATADWGDEPDIGE